MFTDREKWQAADRETFINPLVYTFWGNHGPSIMTMPAALAK